MTYPLLDVARLLLLPGETAEARVARNRAVSTAYYAIFSEVCAPIAKTFVEPEHAAGAISEASYQRAFRALEHATLRKIALKIAEGGRERSKTVPMSPAKAVQHVWASNCIALQEARYSADYDPFFTASLQEAESRILQAEEALEALTKIGEAGRRQLAFDLVFTNQRPTPRS
ncbi:hypothetical protein [Aquidulcibacter sp.]|uniref:hypothetical protein n=1 Tax=Aquidulcibacter sp. TaxID=2052990 RepID=UPI0025B83442|nr:hypothetical protein [Aquidulcibacter sp.]MCA3693960.1 hypothetical protein [Aquidulcibacter sp.]